MLNTTWWGWEVGIQTFKTAELCCLFVASGSTYFPAKKCHPPKKPPSQPSMVGGWPPSMIFRSKMDPRLASSLTQEAWRQGTMNWTDGRDVNRTLSEIWRSYRGVVPKKSNPVHFGHNTNIIVAQDFFFFFKNKALFVTTSFCVDFCCYKTQSWKRGWNNGSPEGENGGEENLRKHRLCFAHLRKQEAFEEKCHCQSRKNHKIFLTSWTTWNMQRSVVLETSCKLLWPLWSKAEITSTNHLKHAEGFILDQKTPKKHLTTPLLNFYIPKVSFDGFCLERYEEFPV